MRPFRFLTALTLVSSTVTAKSTKSAKRGLVSTPNANWPDDDAIWVHPDSPISWYYNFHWNVSSSYASLPQDEVEFVPMMWGGGANDTHFLGNVTALMNTPSGSGRKITHVLAFNLPDQPLSHGGSEMAPAVAARAWVRNLVPLRERGIKIGLPVVGDPRGGWMDPFLANCTLLNEGKERGFDFVPLHSFGGLGVLQDKVGMFSSAFPGVSLWVTEYGYNDQNLTTTQEFFNQSLSYLDGSDVVQRYCWFGSFRGVVSNVGPNQAMLDPYGNLTDIGSWYLGGDPTGNSALPTDTPGEICCTADRPCGDNAASVRSRGLWSVVLCLVLLL
ncbi:Glycosyl hydrolase catalytic core-domain-containing protein [Madurella fahalii]|uniref:Glycosyl hydrolase catalytic core-domain-containing protein n=1 Tax=Madurella fahalii TaxID=1157608 RepID=A0ABQ0GG75_9PEZI